VGRKQEKGIIRHITLDDLNKKIKKEEKSVRVLERLYFIRFLYKGDTIKEACEKIDITEPTGYGWLDSWNKGGYVGLAPNFSGGPKPKLGDAEREELKRLLGEKDAWTLKEVRMLLKEKFNVEYSEMQVWRMPLNYSFDCAGVRFISLNTPDPNNASGDDPQTSLALAQSQESWLREHLDNTMLGTFTIHHHPIWGYGRTTINSDLAPWETLYHTYNISANFAGHIHNYERFQVEGIPYFIVGIGGGECEDLNSTDPRPVWYKFGMTKRLGYLKVTVDPANNTATAQEISVAKVKEDNDNETPQIYNKPVINDTITFPLKPNASHTSASYCDTCRTINKEQIKIGNRHAEAYESGSAMNNITIVTSQGP
jgi:putative transposase